VKAAAVPSASPMPRTVCNQKNEKGKLCNGHLKQLRTAASRPRCTCVRRRAFPSARPAARSTWGRRSVTLRDPQKQQRFVEPN